MITGTGKKIDYRDGKKIDYSDGKENLLQGQKIELITLTEKKIDYCVKKKKLLRSWKKMY